MNKNKKFLKMFSICMSMMLVLSGVIWLFESNTSASTTNIDKDIKETEKK